MKKKKGYLLLSIVILTIEVLIAIVFKDSFIRPILGDYFIVLLLYCILKTVSNLTVTTAAITVLLGSYVVEFLQYINILKLLGLKKTTASNLVLGSSFDWYDIIAYTLAFTTIIILEGYRIKSKNNS